MPAKPAKPPAGRPRSIRLLDAEWADLEQWGREWGPVQPLTPTSVMRELIRRERGRRAGAARRNVR